MLINHPLAKAPEFKHTITAKAGDVLVKLPMILMETSQSEAYAGADKRTLALLACSFVDIINDLLDHPERPMKNGLYNTRVDTSGANRVGQDSGYCEGIVGCSWTP